MAEELARLAEQRGRDAIEIVEREHPYGNGTGYLVKASLTPQERDPVRSLLSTSSGRERDTGLRTVDGREVPLLVQRCAAGLYARGARPLSALVALKHEGCDVDQAEIDRAFCTLRPRLQPAPETTLLPDVPVMLTPVIKARAKSINDKALQLGFDLDT